MIYNPKRIQLYLKVFHYELIEKTFGRNRSFEISTPTNAAEDPTMLKIEAYDKMNHSITFMVPSDFFKLNDFQQCNELATQMALEHKLQKHG